jgi:orotate phosphoribosyltransferase
MTASDLLSTLPVRQGHFLLESGYHANLWVSLESLFVDTARATALIRALTGRLRRYDVTAVCGPMFGGAFLALAIANELGAHFYFTRQQDSAHEGLFRATYTLPSELHALVRNERVALVDDAISAGSSVRATKIALDDAGATTVVVGALVTLGNTARDYFEALGIPMEALSHREFNMWKPAECPLCAAGACLVNP